jgi:hypothetical protein
MAENNELIEFAPNQTLKATIGTSHKKGGGMIMIATKDNKAAAWLKENAPKYGSFFPQLSWEKVHTLFLNDDLDAEEVNRKLNAYNQQG